MASTAVSFVAETLGVSFLGVGSFACIRFSPVPGPELDKNWLVERGRRKDGGGPRAAKLASRARAVDSMLGFYLQNLFLTRCRAAAPVNSPY
jgi:hypothetical protein